MESVRAWADQQGFHYHFVGDELFDLVDPKLDAKLRGRNPIRADLARLRLMENYLRTPGRAAIWVDADTLCLAPSWRPVIPAVAGFGEECWIQPGAGGRFQRFFTPHNAFMVFSSGSAVLPYLRFAAQSMIERVDSARIAPQMIGPKLLKALHSLSPFTLFPEAGAASPALIRELATAPSQAVACYKSADRPPLALVNLCASLAGTEVSEDDLQRLISERVRWQCLS